MAHLGVRLAHLGARCAHLGAGLARVGARFAHVGAILEQRCAETESRWAHDGPTWGQDGAKMALSRLPSFLASPTAAAPPSPSTRLLARWPLAARDPPPNGQCPTPSWWLCLGSRVRRRPLEEVLRTLADPPHPCSARVWRSARKSEQHKRSNMREGRNSTKEARGEKEEPTRNKKNKRIYLYKLPINRPMAARC